MMGKSKKTRKTWTEKVSRSEVSLRAYLGYRNLSPIEKLCANPRSKQRGEALQTEYDKLCTVFQIRPSYILFFPSLSSEKGIPGFVIVADLWSFLLEIAAVLTLHSTNGTSAHC